MNTLLSGIKLLTMDNLGGSCSRGCGKIEFIFEKTQLKEKLQLLDPFANIH